MAVTTCAGASLTRRRFLMTAASAGAAAVAAGIAKPSISRVADRPVITHGIQSGDVSPDSAVVWARADRPSRMLVEIATSDSFKTIRSAAFVDALRHGRPSPVDPELAAHVTRVTFAAVESARDGLPIQV